MSYEEVMRLPVKAFWFLNATIDRIQAQKDMRALTVAACSQADKEAKQSYRERLIVEVGTIVKLRFDPIRDAEHERDTKGIAELRELAQQ